MYDVGFYPEPTQIIIDDQTDFSKMYDQARPLEEPSSKRGVRRVAVGIKHFTGEAEFIAWQKEAPREIFEITPTSITVNGEILNVIHVTYSWGIIEWKIPSIYPEETYWRFYQSSTELPLVRTLLVR